MSGATDSGMVKTMGAIMGAMVLFAIICAAAARTLGGDDGGVGDPMMKTALLERIAPVASVRTSVDELPAVAESGIVTGGAEALNTEVAAAPTELTDSIRAAVDTSCAGCHASGVANAPKFGDKAAWEERAGKGMEALVASVINGLNVMPPRGASTLSDAEIPFAIEYMMSK